MGTVLVLIGIGFVFALLVFFFCEEKSLKDVKFSDMKCMITEEANISECFEKFKTVVLDFAGVEEIGQAFSDEIFRVFATSHPEVDLISVNAAVGVQQMIVRAISTRT